MLNDGEGTQRQKAKESADGCNVLGMGTHDAGNVPDMKIMVRSHQFGPSWYIGGDLEGKGDVHMANWRCFGDADLGQFVPASERAFFMCSISRFVTLHVGIGGGCMVSCSSVKFGRK